MKLDVGLKSEGFPTGAGFPMGSKRASGSGLDECGRGCCAVHSPRASLSREMVVDRDKLFKRMRGQAFEILALVSCIGNTPTRYASRRQLRSLQLPSINIFTEGELRSKVWASAIYKHAQCTPTACASDSLISDFPR